jgi:hypothetical protein
MNDVWLGKDGFYRVLATDVKDALIALRAHLIARKEIGKWSPVTVELETSTSAGHNIYREVS